MSIFGGGGGSTQAASPPKPVLADPTQLEQQALGADTLGYNLSDQDFASRFPGLVSSRNQQLNDAYNQLTGPLDPNVQQSFMNQGIGQSMGAFGGGNPYATINKDTASGKAVETSLANNVQQKQDYDRINFESLLGANPQRQFGLTGGDVANLSAANTQAQNAYQQSKYAGQYGTYSSNQAAAGQQSGATLGAIASIAAAALLAFSDKRLKTDIEDTGVKTKDDIPIKTFRFKSDKKKQKQIGLVADDVEKKRPDAVARDFETGFKKVDYGKLLAEALR